MEPGSTVEVDKAPRGRGARGRASTIIGPVKGRKRQTVGVGAKGAEGEGDGDGDSPGEGSGPDLPEDPEVLPEVPDAPPAAAAADEPSPDDQ